MKKSKDCDHTYFSANVIRDARERLRTIAELLKLSIHPSRSLCHVSVYPVIAYFGSDLSNNGVPILG